MIEKRFTDVWCSETGQIGVTDNGIDKTFTGSEFEEFLNSLNEVAEENEQLKSENNMLKVTIGRNEAYINRLTNKGEWRTDTVTSNKELSK